MRAAKVKPMKPVLDGTMDYLQVRTGTKIKDTGDFSVFLGTIKQPKPTKYGRCAGCGKPLRKQRWYKWIGGTTELAGTYHNKCYPKDFPI